MTTEQKAESLIGAYEQMVAMLPVLGGGMVEDSVEVCRAYLEALAVLREWDNHGQLCPFCCYRPHTKSCRLAAALEGR